MITEELARRLTDQEILKNKNLMVLKVDEDPKKLLKLTQEELKPIRDKLMAPMGMKFDAPNRVSIYLMGDNTLILENFNDNPVDVTLEMKKLSSVTAKLTIPTDGASRVVKTGNVIDVKGLTPRTLVVYEYK